MMTIGGEVIMTTRYCKRCGGPLDGPYIDPDSGERYWECNNSNMKVLKPAFDDEAELCLRQVMTVTGEDVWERQKGIIATWLNTVSKRGK